MPKSGDQTRRAILDAANRIVQNLGAERLTLELTAHEAGISKGGLLYHFPSKQALISGMIRYYLDRFTSDLSVAANQEGSAPGKWTRAYLTTTYEDKQRVPSMTSGLLAAVATDPSLLEPLQAGFKSWVALLDQDEIDPTVAAIIRLAVDGLWMVELFGLAPPDPAQREKVFTLLLSMSRQHPAE